MLGTAGTAGQHKGARWDVEIGGVPALTGAPLNCIKNEILRGDESLGGHCVATPNTHTHHLWHEQVNNNNFTGQERDSRE